MYDSEKIRRFMEDDMSHSRSLWRALVVVLALILVVCFAGSAIAQETPKSELFVGYQWLNPG